MVNNPGNIIQDISIEAVYDFIYTGDSKNADPAVIAYLSEMDKVRGMRLRIDKYGSKQAVINHLVKVDGYSPYLANKLFHQTLEYFHSDQQTSKEAFLMAIVDDMEKDINMAALLAETSQDFSRVLDMRKKRADVIIEALPDADPFDDEAFDRPIKIYTMTPEDAGLEEASKKELDAFIDTLPDISELVKERLRVEGRTIPGALLIDPAKDPRKI